jgi:hypothetical protein
MWWNDVPRGTMDKVSSYVRLDLPLLARPPKRLFRLILESHAGRAMRRFRREARARERHSPPQSWMV